MFITSLVSVQAKTYHFAYIYGLVDQEVSVIIMDKVYQRLGLGFQATPLPGLRAQQQANSGAVDGEVMRIFAYGGQTPNVIRVPTPFYSVITMGYVKKGSNIKVLDKSSLASYKLVKVLGVKHTDLISDEVDPKKIYNAHDPLKMMRYLQSGGAQIALTNPLEGTVVLKQLGYNNIIPLEKALAKQPLYHYLHKKNQHLVPLVDDMLQKLKASGELADIIHEAEQTVIKRRTKQ